jgi:hypothetical protein
MRLDFPAIHSPEQIMTEAEKKKLTHHIMVTLLPIFGGLTLFAVIALSVIN